jgi:hypothetical protein
MHRTESNSIRSLCLRDKIAKVASVPLHYSVLGFVERR